MHGCFNYTVNDLAQRFSKILPISKMLPVWTGLWWSVYSGICNISSGFCKEAPCTFFLKPIYRVYSLAYTLYLQRMPLAFFMTIALTDCWKVISLWKSPENGRIVNRNVSKFLKNDKCWNPSASEHLTVRPLLAICYQVVRWPIARQCRRFLQWTNAK